MPLEIVIWDVQHGSASYIKTPNNRHIVQDLGTGSYGENNKDFSPLLHIKNKWKVDRLDYVIISHPHKDHINDILNFEELSPRVFCRPKHLTEDEIMEYVRSEDKYLFDKYFEINQRYSGGVSSENDPDLPDNYGGVNIQTFHPRSCSTSNINDHSIVTVLSFARSKIILSGDNETCSWDELLKKNEFRKAIQDADLFLASHHGRESGYHSDIFEYFKPKLTIISDGRFCDTSATDRYSEISDGWEVHHRNGETEKRYCITTRNDGVIVVKLGYTPKNNPFIKVTID